MKLRTRLFLAAFGIAGVSLLLAAALVAWSLQRQLLDRITNELVGQAQLVAELTGTEWRRPLRGRPRWRGGHARRPARGARHDHRQRGLGPGRLGRRRRVARRNGEPRHSSGDHDCPRSRRRRDAPLQHHSRPRSAVRRGGRRSSGNRFRPARAPADCRGRSDQLGAEHHRRGVAVRARRRSRARLDYVDGHEPAGPDDCGSGATLPPGRPGAAGWSLRER